MLCTLMHKKIAVARILIDDETAGILKVLDVTDVLRLPVGCRVSNGLPERKGLNDWWRGRAIPASRSGIRQALEAMSLSHTEQLLTKCYGLSLSDHYWINPKDNPLDWDKINFFDNQFSEDVGNALFGQAAPEDGLDLVSPDNTSDGWLKKKWKIIDGKRCLVKGGSNPYQQEPMCETLATALYKRLGCMAFVTYSLIWEEDLPYSVCENFVTKDTEFVNAYSIFLTRKHPNHRSVYDHFLDCCENLGIPNMREFLDYLLATDFIIANTDRHMGNFGALRNADTLEWIGAAPIFDSGTSLWHDQVTQGIHLAGDIEAKPFRSKHSEQITLSGGLDMIDFTALHGLDDELRGILSTSSFIDEARSDALCRALNSRVKMLEHIAQIQTQKNSSHGFDTNSV